MTRLAVAVLLLAVGAAGAAAQEDQASLDSAFSRIVGLWSTGDASAVAAYAAGTGLSFELDGQPMGPLQMRQAAAALRRLFDQRVTVDVEAGMHGHLVGDADRAFGEFQWLTRLEGTTIPERTTVFLALMREGADWKVTEIRVLR